MLSTIYTIMIGGAVAGIILWYSTVSNWKEFFSPTKKGQKIEFLSFMFLMWFLGMVLFSVATFWFFVAGDAVGIADVR